MLITVQPYVLTNISLIITTSAAVLAAVVGIILAYHWRRFALSPLGTVGTLGLYAAGCVILVSLMYAAAPTLGL